MLQIKKGKLVYELEYFADSIEWEVKSPKGLYELYTDESLLEFIRVLEIGDEIEKTEKTEKTEKAEKA